jgi:hypothetical protein
MTEEIKKDISPLIFYSLDFAKKMLTEAMEFYPFGAELTFDKNINPVSYYDGDDFPLSDVLLTSIRTILSKSLYENKIPAYCIAFDAKASRDSKSESVDAIVIIIKHYQLTETYSYFYPYTLSSGHSPIIGEPWATFE